MGRWADGEEEERAPTLKPYGKGLVLRKGSGFKCLATSFLNRGLGWRTVLCFLPLLSLALFSPVAAGHFTHSSRRGSLISSRRGSFHLAEGEVSLRR